MTKRASHFLIPTDAGYRSRCGSVTHVGMSAAAIKRGGWRGTKPKCTKCIRFGEIVGPRKHFFTPGEVGVSACGHVRTNPNATGWSSQERKEKCEECIAAIAKLEVRQ